MGGNGQDTVRTFSKLNIAVIGNGRWAQNHIRALKECDAFGGAFDVDVDYKQVILGRKCGNPHGVVIVTDPVMHFPITEYAMKHNVAVYCEKPIATQVWQLEKLMQMRHNAIYQAGFQLLYDPKINMMRDNEAVNHIVSRRLGGNYRNESVVQTLMIHDIAVAAYIFKTTIGVDPYMSWGMRSEVNTNLQFPDDHVAILHARYGLPHFRQMDFVLPSGIITDEFDNHERGDLLAMSIEDWLRAVEARSNSNRAYMRFACNVQNIAFEIDRKIGIHDSVNKRVKGKRETVKAD